jgi:hypothetical protein
MGRTARCLYSQSWKLNAPAISESTDAPSLNEGDYRGDLRDFRDSTQCDRNQRST